MYLVADVMWWVALAPLAVLATFRRDAPTAFWFVALAFAVSFAADLIALIAGGSWIAVPWYQLVQWTFFAMAVVSEGAWDVAPSVLLYVGVGTLFYLLMMAHKDDPAPYTEFMRWWTWYQGVRLASFALFVRAAWRTKTVAS